MSSEVEKPLKPAEQRKKHTRSFSLKVANRRRRVFELRCLGYKIPQIKEKLAEEKQFCSEDTIKADLHSDDATAFLEELERQQFADIALEDDRKVRLEYRDRMIERLKPRKSPDVAVNIANQLQVEKDDTVNQLLRRYQELNQGSSETSSLCCDNSQEPIHKTDSDDKTKTVPTA
jgi:DNA-binding transcriptional MerR regulator